MAIFHGSSVILNCWMFNKWPCYFHTDSAYDRRRSNITGGVNQAFGAMSKIHNFNLQLCSKSKVVYSKMDVALVMFTGALTPTILCYWFQLLQVQCYPLWTLC